MHSREGGTTPPSILEHSTLRSYQGKVGACTRGRKVQGLRPSAALGASLGVAQSAKEMCQVKPVTPLLPPVLRGTASPCCPWLLFRRIFSGLRPSKSLRAARGHRFPRPAAAGVFPSFRPCHGPFRPRPRRESAPRYKTPSGVVRQASCRPLVVGRLCPAQSGRTRYSQPPTTSRRLPLPHHQETHRHHPPDGVRRGINIYNRGQRLTPLLCSGIRVE